MRKLSRTGVAICLALAGLLSSTLPLQAHAAKSDFADPEKVLRTIFPVAETGFDPAATRDLYSNAINEAIFERLFTYDYLASPAKIIPETADGMPEISADGKTYTIKLKKGIYFTPDAAFNGKKRELTVDDYVYSFKRIMDPKI
ncbi:MAG: ABC transporter substrate-binding protein, partial [Pseudomonadota bacterium]